MGRIRTSTRTTQLSDGEKNDILVAWGGGKKTVRDLAVEFARDESTIRRLIEEFRPTTQLARATILARAADIARRVTDKADVDQLIDVLSRPNIGVLDAPVAASGKGNGGANVLINVQAGSLPAINEAEYRPTRGALPEPQPEGDIKNVGLGSTPLAQAYKGD